VRVALLFIDGVGVGRKDPQVNPLARASFLLSQFQDAQATALPPSARRYATDSRFGVPGRPQSASNQTALLTGEPAPRLIGRHVLGYPDRPLRALLAERSIARTLQAKGRTSAFANAYPVEVLDALGLKHRPSPPDGVQLPERWRRRMKPSASTSAMAAADVEFFTLEDARQGRALTNDIDGRRALERGLKVPSRSPEEAAAIFWAVASGADFTLFEHYLADEAGHARDFDAALRALECFDRFAREVVARRPADAEVIICSDHGNVEDLSTRQHTLNDVPVLWFGDSTPPDPPADLSAVGRLVVDRVAG
jgi:hypothetical protein